MKIVFAEEGWDEYLYWQGQDQRTLKRINRLLQSVVREGAWNGNHVPFVLCMAENKKLGLFSQMEDLDNHSKSRYAWEVN